MTRRRLDLKNIPTSHCSGPAKYCILPIDLNKRQHRYCIIGISTSRIRVTATNNVELEDARNSRMALKR
jgi:hypothetical protein